MNSILDNPVLTSNIFEDDGYYISAYIALGCPRRFGIPTFCIISPYAYYSYPRGVYE